jgi:hypothetical protein
MVVSNQAKATRILPKPEKTVKMKRKFDVSSYGKGVYILRLNRMSEVQTQRIVIY